jgi:hypothetical protein
MKSILAMATLALVALVLEDKATRPANSLVTLRMLMAAQ